MKRKRPQGEFVRGFMAQRKRRQVIAKQIKSRLSKMSSTRRATGEVKFLDCAWNAVTINVGAASTGADGELQPSSGCTNAISVPAQGDTESTRDGRKYILKSAYFNGVINTTANPDEADASPNLGGIFFAMVLNKQTNATAINSEDVYINPSTTAGFPMLPQPLRNLQKVTQFQILDYKYVPPGGMYAFTDGANTGSISQQNAQTVSLSWRGNIPVIAPGTTANVTSVTDNSIHILAFAGNVQLVPTFSGKSRVRFIG